MQQKSSVVPLLSRALSINLSLCFFFPFVLLAPFSHGLRQTRSFSAQEVRPSTATIDEINVVARELWCPICSNIRLDKCELKACDQIREQIGLQLDNGASTEQIKNFLFEQYGPLVLGEPPPSGVDRLAWIVPFVVLFAGALFLLRFGRSVYFAESNMSEQISRFPEDANWNRRDGSICEAGENIDNGKIDNDDINHDAAGRYADLLDIELQKYE